MKTKSAQNHLALLLGVAGIAGFAVSSQADTTVKAGWDLWNTVQPTTFGGQAFEGVPLGTFDFGGTIGVKNVGSTDTIVQRLGDAHAPSENIPIELVALHLKSVLPTDFGLGLGLYYITLQSERGGPASLGSMTVNFGPEGDPHGDFSSNIDVFFDIRLGALNGPIALSDSLDLSSAGTSWSHFAPNGAVLIPGVNDQLNGVDNLQDFWAFEVHETHPSGAEHTVKTPEASALLAPMALGFGGLILGAIRKTRREPVTSTSIS